MVEIRNKNRFPVQLVIRSRTAPRAFTTLNVPGIGKGKNIKVIEDELMTEYVQRDREDGIDLDKAHTKPAKGSITWR